MAQDIGRFNTDPIMMHHSSSHAAEDDKLFYQTHFYDVHSDDDQDKEEPMIVPQNLEPEQYRYEFPPKSRLRALAYLDYLQDEQSFFDESSFTSSSTAACLSVDMCSLTDHMSDLDVDARTPPSHIQHWDHKTIFQSSDDDDYDDEEEEEEEEDDDDDVLVDDGRLSPLQLPAQVNRRPVTRVLSSACSDRHARELSGDSSDTITSPVGPSSFLQPLNEHYHHDRPELYHHPRVTQTRNTTRRRRDHGMHHSSRVDSEDVLPIFRNDDVLLTDDDSCHDDNIVLVKLSKGKLSPWMKHPTTASVGSDEGYDDEEDDELPIESASVFLPLDDQEEEEIQVVRESAAIKIQSAWRGYCVRRQPQLATEIVKICGKAHRQYMVRVEDRLVDLERRLREETAMRTAFEKAMEDMTVLIDQQQKVLYDRVEQEVEMRQAYEQKMQHALSQMQPLEQRLRKEIKARGELETMMARVLDQLHDLKMARQQQAKEEAEARKVMQAKLDEAVKEINILKRQTPSSSRTSSSTRSVSATPMRNPALSSRQSVVPRTPQKHTPSITNKPITTRSAMGTTTTTTTTTTAATTKTTKTPTSTTIAHPMARRSIIPPTSARNVASTPKRPLSRRTVNSRPPLKN
ncbi:uncharacterized protein BYT42DRAFT_614498 [Radiomyces spectabilis]|uniref:uncharacterized protein n=1 Tax=Radiomyces spectabilis TaxID=64574 RepID=UPI002220020E|nr:uncharacterized protein BYT42DRAFT_614498 [Radiomyces spectabilis]KAI8377846.1 hypothetical protein BYT42DRAFT_614498 [Radiomyces spectabilis]